MSIVELFCLESVLLKQHGVSCMVRSRLMQIQQQHQQKITTAKIQTTTHRGRCFSAKQHVISDLVSCISLVSDFSLSSQGKWFPAQHPKEIETLLCLIGICKSQLSSCSRRDLASYLLPFGANIKHSFGYHSILTDINMHGRGMYGCKYMYVYIYMWLYVYILIEINHNIPILNPIAYYSKSAVLRHYTRVGVFKHGLQTILNHHWCMSILIRNIATRCYKHS